MYKFSSSSWGGKRLSPHIWAIGYMGFWTNFIFLFLILLYMNVFTGGYVTISLREKVGLYFAGAFIFGSNYFYFLRHDRWKSCIFFYDQISHRKKIIGFIIVSFVLLMLFAAQIYLAYLISLKRHL